MMILLVGNGCEVLRTSFKGFWLFYAAMLNKIPRKSTEALMLNQEVVADLLSAQIG